MTDEIENNSAGVNAAVMEILKDRKLTAEERDFIVKHERTHEAMMEEWERNRFNVETDIRINAELEKDLEEEDQEAGQVYSRVIEEGLIGLGKSSFTKDPQAESITFDCTRNENQTGDKE